MIHLNSRDFSYKMSFFYLWTPSSLKVNGVVTFCLVTLIISMKKMKQAIKSIFNIDIKFTFLYHVYLPLHGFQIISREDGLQKST